MVDDRAQSSDVGIPLSTLEAMIRNRLPVDDPWNVHLQLEVYETSAPDDRERFLGIMIEAVRGHHPIIESQLAWAILKELSARIQDRDEQRPTQLADFAMEHLADRIQERRARGRPARSFEAKLLVVAAHRKLIEDEGCTVGEAQRRIADWLTTKPDAVAQIISDWNRNLPELNSKINGSN